MTPGSLENASVTTWASQLSTIEAQAGDREKFATELVVQVSDPLKAAAAQFEDLRKSHNEFFGRLEKERESVSNDLKKTRGKYDGACQEVESRRKKMESSFDHNKTKAQAAYQQQVWDMNNVKVGIQVSFYLTFGGLLIQRQNTYLININVTNETRAKFFHTYIPNLVDVSCDPVLPCICFSITDISTQGLQDLNEARVAKLNSIWTLATELDKKSLTNSIDHMTNFLSEIPHNNPQFDSAMFLRHNISQLQDPPKVIFEPSPVWHDNGELATDDTAKVFLRNLLTKSKSQVREFRVEVDKKKREVDDARRIRDNVRQGRDKQRNEADVVRGTLGLEEQLQALDQKLVAAQAEMSTVISAVGDLSIGAKNHNFKAQTFKIPTNCDLCGERIWGLSAKGFDCRDCGYTCHSKCEMKVPAECPGEVSKEEKKKLKVERQEKANITPSLDPATSSTPETAPPLTRKDTMNTLSSDYTGSSIEPVPTPPSETKPTAATSSRRRSVLPPPPAHYVSPPPPTNGSANKPGTPKGKMLYSYQAGGDDEVTVREGDEVSIEEPDGKHPLFDCSLHIYITDIIIDGSGWMLVRAGAKKGLVPASYVEVLRVHSPSPSTTGPQHTDRPGSTYSNSSLSVAGSVTTKRVGPAVAPRRGAKKVQYVEALYDYEARSDLEWSIGEGDRFVLVNRDSGGGWADVERGGVTKCVPANYIQEV